jgi:hypothetical protein
MALLPSSGLLSWFLLIELVSITELSQSLSCPVIEKSPNCLNHRVVRWLRNHRVFSITELSGDWEITELSQSLSCPVIEKSPSCLNHWVVLLIETSSINRTHLSRPEEGRRAIFRNVVNFYILYFTFHILFTIKTTHKVQQTSSSQRSLWSVYHNSFLIGHDFASRLKWSKVLPSVERFGSDHLVT